MRLVSDPTVHNSDETREKQTVRGGSPRRLDYLGKRSEGARGCVLSLRYIKTSLHHFASIGEIMQRYMKYESDIQVRKRIYYHHLWHPMGRLGAPDVGANERD